MKIARFGDTWATGYVFSDTLMEDDYRHVRRVVSDTVSGASGAWDYYGTNPMPIEPVVAKKKFALTAASKNALEDAMMALKNATSGRGERSKLWFLDRDGTTYYWIYAKCIGLNSSDRYTEGGQWLKPVEIEFWCPEGLWYSESQQSDASALADGATINTSMGGNVPLIPVRVEVAVAGGSASTVDSLKIEYTSGAGLSVGSEWTFGATVAAGDTLIVDASTFVVTNGGTDAYSDLTIGSGQVSWLTGDGANYRGLADINVGFAQFTTTVTWSAAPGTATITLKWYDTYVL